MKKFYVLAVCLALALVMGARADELKPIDELSTMTIVELQNYLGGLKQEDFNKVVKDILGSGNARLIRVGIAAAQKTLNAKSQEDRAEWLNTLLAENPGKLVGTISANGSVLLGKASTTPKATKIGADVPTASKVATVAGP